MPAPEHFEQIGTRGFYRPVGVVTFEHAVQNVAQAMRYAREHGLEDLLVNTLGLSGFPPPDTFERYSLAVAWAGAAGGALRVALVARADAIDPQRIGVLMAQNRGVNGDVFTNEKDALAWLNARI
jgi:hypothetical protein